MPVVVIGSSAVYSTDEVDPGEWAHVACVHDDAANTLAVYVDGRISNEATGVPASTGGSTGTRLGAGLAGGLDDIRVYARALAATQLKALKLLLILLL